MTDGAARCRITFYWQDAGRGNQPHDRMACSDLLLKADSIAYWCHDEWNQSHIISFDCHLADQEWRPRDDNTLDPELRSILDIISRTAVPGTVGRDTPGMVRFFQEAKGRGSLTQTVQPVPTETPTQGGNGGYQRNLTEELNRPRLGRRYDKRADTCTAAWSMSKVAVPKKMVEVLVRPRPLGASLDPSTAFDPNTLGRFPAIPECYRRYWSLEHALAALDTSSTDVSAAQRVLGEIVSYLRDEPQPEQVILGLQYLRFTAALRTGSFEAISSAAKDYVAAYAGSAGEPVDQVIAELGRIADSLRKHCSQEQTRDFILSLLRPLIDPKVFADAGFVGKAIVFPAKIQGPWFGLLVLDCVEEAGCQDPNLIARWREELIQAGTPSPAVPTPDPNELTPSMMACLESMQMPPVEGELTLEGLGQMIDRVVNRATEDSDASGTRESGSRVGELVHLLAGEGPFDADPERLSAAISAFDRRYQPPEVTVEQKHLTLACFVSLSFLDTSTPQDRDRLAAQIAGLYEMVEGKAIEIVQKHQLVERITVEDVHRIFAAGHQRLDQVIPDPLWPMFKFPLSSGERTALLTRLNQELRRIDSEAGVLCGKLQGSEAESSPALGTFRAQVADLVQRVLMRVIELRSPKIGIRLRWNTRSLPLVIVRRDGFKDAAEATATMQELKYFYLGHRTRLQRAAVPENDPSEEPIP